MNNNTVPFNKNSKRNEKDLSSKEMYNRLNYKRKENDVALENKQKK